MECMVFYYLFMNAHHSLCTAALFCVDHFDLPSISPDIQQLPSEKPHVQCDGSFVESSQPGTISVRVSSFIQSIDFSNNAIYEKFNLFPLSFSSLPFPLSLPFFLSFFNCQLSTLF